MDRSLLALLHLCDSLFPIGAFAHSDGLEAATSAGRVSTSDDLRAWLDVCLDESLARVDGPAVLRAWRAADQQRWADLAAIDGDVHALRPSAAARAAARAMGSRLLKTWRRIHPDDGWLAALEGSGGRAATLPVVFGVICRSQDLDARSAVGGFLYTRLAATVSAAMRLMPIGQGEAHALLAAMLARVPGTIDDVALAVERGDGPGAFAPALDIAAMEQRFVRSRLFLS